MNGRVPPSGRAALVALICASVASCADPFGFSAPTVEPEEQETCPASEEWLPNTSPVPQFNPLPHPATDCPFHRGAWQNFLVATQPDAAGRPAFLSYPSVDSLFTPARARPPGNRALLGNIKQPGGRQILLDQNGRTLFYGLQANAGFADFVNRNNLKTRDGIERADPNLFFPAGVVTFKSAWQEANPADPANATYITVQATVPRIRQLAGGEIREDRNNPREATLRLLAMHVAFTLPGHPEFIWSTFEHTAGPPDTRAEDGKRNVAPIIPFNPDVADPSNLRDATSICPDGFHLLCKPGTRTNEANRPIPETALRFDDASQSFPGQQTSIYRVFPASRSHTTNPDGALTSLNHNVEQLFNRAMMQGRLQPNDKRGFYRQVGALWMDKPAYFTVNSPIQNDSTSPFAGQENFAQSIAERGADSELSILAGQDRLSSTAMNAFTQAPDAYPNCFSCHNTQAVTDKGAPLNRDPQGQMLIGPKLINVSRIFSEFLLSERQAAAGMGQ
jgi:hypothetical protein